MLSIRSSADFCCLEETSTIILVRNKSYIYIPACVSLKNTSSTLGLLVLNSVLSKDTPKKAKLNSFNKAQI